MYGQRWSKSTTFSIVAVLSLINDLFVVASISVIETKVKLVTTALALWGLLAAMLRRIEFGHRSFNRVVSVLRASGVAPLDGHLAAHSAGLYFQNRALRDAIGGLLLARQLLLRCHMIGSSLVVGIISFQA